MKNYRVRTGCEIAGQWRNAGEIIPLSDAQAKYLAPPLGNVVRVATKKDLQDAEFGRNERDHGAAAD